MPTLLLEHGIDPATLLAEFQLKPTVYEDPENTIPFATVCQLITRGAEAAGCAHFGLLVGQRTGISAFGALGYLMQSSATVRAALEACAKHYRVHNSGASPALVEDGAFAALSFTIVQPGIERTEQFLDGAMALAFNLMRTLCGHDWQPVEVRLAHARPKDIAPLRQFFRVPLVFDADETSLVFDSHWLDRPLPGADPTLRLLMQQRITDLESRVGDDLMGLLRRVLPAMIAAHRASAAEVAGRAGLGVRTLNRRLAAQGTSFLELRDEARHTVARQLLESTRMPVMQVADHLGYANASAFTRAFQRWAGMGPAQWRASHRPRPRGPSRKA